MTIPLRPPNDGRSLPAVALGTYGLRGDDGVASVISALDAGYRLLGTALNYENEGGPARQCAPQRSRGRRSP